MKLNIHKLSSDEVIAVSQLICTSFMDTVAPTLTSEGISTFMIGVTPKSIEQRLAGGNIFLVCKNDTQIVGVIEIRDQDHVNLLFVKSSMQRKGIGRKLLHSLICEVSTNQLSVNASLNSVNAYKNLGFHNTGSQSEAKGIRYQPMAMLIK